MSFNAYYATLNTGLSSLELETIISKYSYDSYLYAIRVLKGKFKLGEKEISQSCYYSYGYAKDIIKGRFELGEEAISKVSSYSCDYLIKVMRYNHD